MKNVTTWALNYLKQSKSSKHIVHLHKNYHYHRVCPEIHHYHSLSYQSGLFTKKGGMKNKEEIMQETSTQYNLTYLSQKEAQQIDDELMDYSKQGFSVDQLMEMAGMSCAHAIFQQYPPTASSSRVLIIIGPGNNGGDGLVAARHLRHFGYEKVTCLIPKKPSKELYQRLMVQCENVGVKIIDSLHLCPSSSSSHSSSPSLKSSSSSDVTEDYTNLYQNFDLIVDAIFGFSFTGNTIRSPFNVIIKALNTVSENKTHKISVISIDIPSGWDVEKGDIHGIGLNPTMLISLTAPKHCAKSFNGIHYVGGRFVPFDMVKKYNLVLPNYKGTNMVERIN